MSRTPLITLLLVVLLPVTGLGTAQDPDVLIFDGKSYELYSNPLEDYFSDGPKRPDFFVAPKVISSGNWRGYVATWQIVDDRLYLIKIDSWFCERSVRTKNGCRKVTLPDIFGKKVVQERVFADWYSDQLRVPEGKQLQYVHSGYASIYERDIMFEVAAGKIIKREVKDNTKEPLPSELEVMQKELERLKAKAAKSKPAPQPTVTVEPFIITETGWGKVVIGGKRKDIDAALGKGDHDGRTYDDVYFIEYPQRGVQISYSVKNDLAGAIFFYNKQAHYSDFTVPPLKTDKGVTWTSSPDDVVKAYGAPPRNFSDESGGNRWRRMEYDKIDFLFEGGRLTRISLTEKNCTGCKE